MSDRLRNDLDFTRRWEGPKSGDRLHLGRAWNGHDIEDACPCEQAPCGLVVPDPAIPCDQHNPTNYPLSARTMRQMHWSSACPAAVSSEG
jgi:hypothetical protein